MRTRGQIWKENDSRFFGFYRWFCFFTVVSNNSNTVFIENHTNTWKKVEKSRKMSIFGQKMMFFGQKQANFIIFSQNFCSKKKFFFQKKFSLAFLGPEKKIKNIFFSLRKGRNRFFSKFGRVSSPLNPMLAKYFVYWIQGSFLTNGN